MHPSNEPSAAQRQADMEHEVGRLLGDLEAEVVRLRAALRATLAIVDNDLYRPNGIDPDTDCATAAARSLAYPEVAL